MHRVIKFSYYTSSVWAAASLCVPLLRGGPFYRLRQGGYTPPQHFPLQEIELLHSCEHGKLGHGVVLRKRIEHKGQMLLVIDRGAVDF